MGCIDRLSQNKSSVLVSYCSDGSTNEDSSAYKTCQSFYVFISHKYIVLLTSFLITTSLLPARGRGSNKCIQTRDPTWKVIREVKSIAVAPNKVWESGRLPSHGRSHWIWVLKDGAQFNKRVQLHYRTHKGSCQAIQRLVLHARLRA